MIHFLLAALEISELKSGLWDGLRYAIDQSSLPGLIVCVVLILISSFAWTVMITKLLMVWNTRRNTKRFLKMFRAAKNPLALYQGKVAPKACPAKHVYDAACGEVCFHVVGSTMKNDTFEARLQGAGKVAPSQMEAIENTMERAVGECALKLEGQMTVLASAVSGAPFLGLLGTVWGVMDTFGSVAMSGGATSLAALAPGVSAALLTTVTGLLVAIPAMFGYNFLASAIKGMVIELDNFASELGGAINRSYVEHGRRFESLPSMTALGAAVSTEQENSPSRKKGAPSLALSDSRMQTSTPPTAKKETAKIEVTAEEEPKSQEEETDLAVEEPNPSPGKAAIPPAVSTPVVPLVSEASAATHLAEGGGADPDLSSLPKIQKVVVGEDNSRISDEEWARQIRESSMDLNEAEEEGGENAGSDSVGEEGLVEDEVIANDNEVVLEKEVQSEVPSVSAPVPASDAVNETVKISEKASDLESEEMAVEEELGSVEVATEGAAADSEDVVEDTVEEVVEQPPVGVIPSVKPPKLKPEPVRPTKVVPTVPKPPARESVVSLGVGTEEDEADVDEGLVADAELEVSVEEDEKVQVPAVEAKKAPLPRPPVIRLVPEIKPEEDSSKF